MSAVEDTERSVLELVAAGYAEIIGHDANGDNVYRLTEAGIRRAEEIIETAREVWTVP